MAPMLRSTPSSRRRLAVLAIPLLAAATGACDTLFPRRSPGETLYRELCAECHGLDGAGNTPKYMGNANADLLDDRWEHVVGDADSIEEIIKFGIFAKMPARPELTDEQLRHLADWVLYLRGEER